MRRTFALTTALLVWWGTLTAPGVAAVSTAAVATAGCAGQTATIVGTDGADVLVGTDGTDVIQGGKGQDDISGLGGDDVLCGGKGNDTVGGGRGADRVFGGPDGRRNLGDGPYFIGDVLTGGPGNDALVGGDKHDGRDFVSYTTSQRAVDVDLGAGTAVGQGRDRLTGVEIVLGTRFGDRMYAMRADLDPVAYERGSHLYGAGGADTLRGDGELYGQAGPDTLVAVGAGYAEGGAGRDDMRFALPAGQGAPGRPTAQGRADLSAVFEGGPGDDVLDFSVAGRSFSDPGRGDDLVAGSDGKDSVRLSPGDDTVSTGRGDDDVLGGFGDDRIWTGPGADTITVWCGTTHLQAGDGADVVRSGRFYTTHCREPGDDVLGGGRGADTLDYRVLRLFRTDPGVTVDLAADTAAGANGSDIIPGFEHVVGSGGVDHLSGDDGANVLSGHSGNGQLAGRSGEDTLIGDAQTDAADGGDGRDACRAETEIGCEA